MLNKDQRQYLEYMLCDEMDVDNATDLELVDAYELIPSDINPDPDLVEFRAAVTAIH